MANLYENLIDLDLNYQIQDSNSFLDILYLQLQINKIRLTFLENNKPSWYQKQKLKNYNQEKEKLEKLVNDYKRKINEELELIVKMENINN